MQKVLLYFLPVEKIKNNFNLIYESVSTEEKEKANRIIGEEDRLLSLGGSFLISTYLKDKEIKRTPLGKPYTDGMFFNISHSKGLVGLAVCSKNEVGLDIEKIKDKNEELKEYCLSEEEIKSGNSFLTLFTAKESLVKAEGGGLNCELKSIPALPIHGKVIYNGQNFFRHAYIYEGYSVSVTLKDSDFIIKTQTL